MLQELNEDEGVTVVADGAAFGSQMGRILERPYDYIDGEQYLSWKRFFTKLLVDTTEETWMQYSKTRLNPAYLQGRCRERIFATLPSTMRGMLDDSSQGEPTHRATEGLSP